VRDYINLYTPYRGLLLYHGLGSGKTCTSIAIAEGMKNSNKVIIMTPASLRANYVSQLKECGDQLYKKTQYQNDSNPYKNLYNTPDDFYHEKIEEAKAAIAIQILKEKAIELLKTITNNNAADCDADKKTIEEKDAEIERLKEQLAKKCETSTDNKDNNLILSFNNNNSTDTQTNCENPEKDEQIKKLEQEIIQLKLQELKNVAIRALQKLLPDSTTNNNTTEEEKKNCDEQVNAKIDEVVKQKDEEMKKALLSVIEGGDNATDEAINAFIKKLDIQDVNKVIKNFLYEKYFQGDVNEVEIKVQGITSNNIIINFNSNAEQKNTFTDSDDNEQIEQIGGKIKDIIKNAELKYQLIEELTNNIYDNKNDSIVECCNLVPIDSIVWIYAKSILGPCSCNLTPNKYNKAPSTVKPKQPFNSFTYLLTQPIFFIRA
jgi:hypothetical protein